MSDSAFLGHTSSFVHLSIHSDGHTVRGLLNGLLDSNLSGSPQCDGGDTTPVPKEPEVS